MQRTITTLTPLLTALALATPALADTNTSETAIPDLATLDTPVAAALAAVSDDVRAFDQHIDTLANPFFQGRVPGSPGSEFAKRYIEFYFHHAGLEKPFENTSTGDMSYRQPFAVGGRVSVATQSVAFATPDGHAHAFTAGQDYTATGLGSSGNVTGGPVFIGYSIANGPDGYTSFTDDTDLAGKIALMLRFEPMNDDGTSAFANRGWSSNASFNAKIGAVARYNPAAIIIANPPGSMDPRATRLLSPNAGGSPDTTVPVFHMTTDAADRLLQAADPEGRSINDFRALADNPDTARPIALAGELTLSAQLERQPLIAENIAGLLPGKGDLADQLIVVGAHFDHMGNGSFDTPTTLEDTYNGADDNASGTVGVIMLAQRMAEHYANLDDHTHARSILFIGFDAEESGLWGAEHYVNEPLVPLSNHHLMVNFDMIGRVTQNRISITGTRSAEGFRDMLAPHFENSGLDIVEPTNVSRRSDHAPFYYRGNMPVLFAIISPLHAEYHTAADLAWKINRTGAVKVIDLFENIVKDAATMPDQLVFAGDTTPQRPAARVFFGVVPTNVSDAETGVAFTQVVTGSSAAEAGIQPGDILIEWDGEPVDTVAEWREALREHNPGDTISLTIVRNGESIDLEATLRSR